MAFYLVIILSWLTSLQAILATRLPIIGYSDELLIVVCTFSLVKLNITKASCRKQFKRIKILLMILFAYQLILILAHSLDATKGLFQSIINLKFFIIVLYFCQVPLSKQKCNFLKRNVLFFFLLLVLFIGIELLFGADYYNYFDLRMIDRYGVLRYSSFLGNPNLLGLIGGLLTLGSITNFAYCSCRQRTNGRRYKPLLILLTGIILILLSLSRIPILALCFSIPFIIMRIPLKQKVKSLRFGIILFFIVGIFASDIFIRHFKITEEATFKRGATYTRNIQLLSSIEIANDFFPFGSGPGTFLSKMSVTGDVSELYNEYKAGISTIVIENAHGIYDNNIASFLSELGYCGFGLVLLFCWVLIKSSYGQKHDYWRWLSFGTLLYIIPNLYVSPIMTSGFQVIVIGGIIGFGLNRFDGKIIYSKAFTSIHTNNNKKIVPDTNHLM